MEGITSKKESGTEQIKVIYTVMTEASERHPERNEDSFFADPNIRAFAVFDGVSGKEDGSGEIASKFVSEYIRREITQIKDGMETKTAENILKNIVIESGRELKKMWKNKYRTEECGKTTASIVKIYKNSEGKNIALIANIGDSRIYGIEEKRDVEQWTEDDNQMKMYRNLSPAERAALKEILDEAMTEEDFMEIYEKVAKKMASDEVFPNEIININLFKKLRSILTKSIGSQERCDPHIESREIPGGLKIAITSDGISDTARKSEISKVFELTETSTEAATKIMEISKERSKDEHSIRSKKDDMTIMIIDVKSV